MKHCAIDLGGRKSQVCIRDEAGQIVWEERCDTLCLPERLRAWPQSRVIVETAAEAFRIADAAKQAGHEVRVVAATLVRALGVGARRTKTDRRDAQVLSEVSSRIDLPSVHIPSPRSREWKTMCGAHDALVSSRTKLINNLRGWMRGQGRRLTAQVEVIRVLSKQIAESERRLRRTAQDDELCRRLMEVPGIGPSAALRFVAAIDEIGRFASAHRVAAYLGLTPGESSSSDHQQRLSITKAGPADVRWVLVQAAHCVRHRCRSPGARPLQLWALEIEKRRGKRIALVALARKLACILFALWRDGSRFELRTP
jgi:transposase